jgi:hypothetical protein
LVSESVASRTCDPDADDFDRSAASLHVLTPRHRKSAADKTSDHVAVEPMDDHEQLLSGTFWVAGEEFQRLTFVPG